MSRNQSIKSKIIHNYHQLIELMNKTNIIKMNKYQSSHHRYKFRVVNYPINNISYLDITHQFSKSLAQSIVTEHNNSRPNIYNHKLIYITNRNTKYQLQNWLREESIQCSNFLHKINNQSDSKIVSKKKRFFNSSFKKETNKNNGIFYKDLQNNNTNISSFKEKNIFKSFRINHLLCDKETNKTNKKNEETSASNFNKSTLLLKTSLNKQHKSLPSNNSQSHMLNQFDSSSIEKKKHQSIIQSYQEKKPDQFNKSKIRKNNSTIEKLRIRNNHTVYLNKKKLSHKIKLITHKSLNNMMNLKIKMCNILDNSIKDVESKFEHIIKREMLINAEEINHKTNT